MANCLDSSLNLSVATNQQQEMQQALELDKQRPPKFILSAGFVGREKEDVYLTLPGPFGAKMKCQAGQKVGPHRRRQGKTLAPRHSFSRIVRQGPCLPDRARVVEECLRSGEQRTGSSLNKGLWQNANVIKGFSKGLWVMQRTCPGREDEKDPPVLDTLSPSLSATRLPQGKASGNTSVSQRPRDRENTRPV